MSWQPPEWTSEYLGPTELCDSDDPEIRRKALEIIKDAKTPKEAALRIFRYVRDQVLFVHGDFDVKASDTLKKGFGHCMTKITLQVALLRAAGIPARYHRAVVSKDCLKGIISSTAFKASADRIPHHPYGEGAYYRILDETTIGLTA